MFDFIPNINIKINNDPFLARIGAIVSYHLKSDYNTSCRDFKKILQHTDWQVNLKDNVLLATKGNICTIVFREGYTSILFDPAKFNGYDEVVEYISDIMNSLSKIGILSFRPFWRIDDEFFFKETTNVNEKYTEVKKTLLSGELLKDKDSYELVENGVSLNIEFSKNVKENSCFLSIYALSLEEIDIKLLIDTLRNYFQITHKTLLNVISEDVRNIMKGETDDE